MGRHHTPAEWSAPSIRTRYTAGMTRYLRIAAAGFFLLLAIALIALWIRSYTWQDEATAWLGQGQSGTAASVRGVVLIVTIRDTDQLDGPTGVRLTSRRVTPPFKSMIFSDSGLLGFWGESGSFLTLSGVNATLPYWFFVGLALAFAALFTFKKSWRFSIRSILIATTLLAVALGLGVYFL
jgi:hypothetical protein